MRFFAFSLMANPVIFFFYLNGKYIQKLFSKNPFVFENNNREITWSRYEIVSGPFGDVRRVSRHHYGTVRVRMIAGYVTGILVFRHFFHQFQDLKNKTKSVRYYFVPYGFRVMRSVSRRSKTMSDWNNWKKSPKIHRQFYKNKKTKSQTHWARDQF